MYSLNGCVCGDSFRIDADGNFKGMNDVLRRKQHI